MSHVNNELSAMGEMVDEFQQEILDLPYQPGLLPQNRQDFRVGHVEEEVQEIKDAYAAKDYAGVIDGAIDAIYILFGMILEMGADPMLCFLPVHEANMKKIRGVTKRGESFDAVKPADWEPPNIEALMAKMRLFASISPAFLEATRIKIERNEQYNQGTVRREDHFPFGDISHAQMHWLKSIRLRSEIEGHLLSGQPLDPAKLSEHLRDAMNYDSFWWEALNGGIRP